MKWPFLPVLVTGLWLVSHTIHATALDLQGYVGPHGEIRTQFEGDVVDPYFATKALLEASSAGLAIDVPALAWIEWALNKQLPNGLFQRYCRTAATGWDWKACATADADDAMMAVWLHLLAERSPPADASSRWKRSMQLAWAQLEKLHNPRLGIYYISHQQPVGLFADNMEVYAALRALARMHMKQGEPVLAQQMTNRADQLIKNLDKVFLDKRHARYRVSTQARTEHAFYPDEVAQLYPWILETDTRNQEASGAAYREWIGRNRSDWLNLRSDHYPWGLVALAALRFADHESAACWLQVATPLRHGMRWNVLEEAALQTVRFLLPPVIPDAVNCPPSAGQTSANAHTKKKERKP